MARPSKKAEVSQTVNNEGVSTETPSIVPEKEISQPPKQQPEGGPKRYKSPTTGFTIEDF